MQELTKYAAQIVMFYTFTKFLTIHQQNLN